MKWVCKMPKGRIFNIQRYSTHDGPGIRTTVFMKGCNLRCLWCHNPESLGAQPVLEFNPDLCIGCGVCVQTCPKGVHEPNHPAAYRDRCSGCGQCTRECFSGALTLAGTEIDSEQVMAEILTDVPYFQQSNGGVTFSGGECMLQIDFLEALLQACQSHDIHTAIDTAGSVPWTSFERVLPYNPLFLYDMKAYDPMVHQKLTRVENTLILSNLEKLLEANARVWVRVPCVPGANDGEMEAIAEWLAGKPVERIELLAYHKLGGGKMDLLGLEHQNEFCVPSDEEMNHWLSYFTMRGLNARVG